MEKLQGWLTEATDIALGWLASPAALSQFALLIAAYFAARYLAQRFAPVVERTLTPRAEATHIIARLRRFALQFLPLFLPLLAYGLTAVGEGLTRSVFGSGEVIAFGKRVFLLLAAVELVRKVLPPGFLKLMGRYVLLPVMALHALGLLDDATARLEAAQVNLGNIQFTVLSLIRGAIAGALLFWLGAWSNRQSAGYIKAQPDLRPATHDDQPLAVDRLERRHTVGAMDDRQCGELGEHRVGCARHLDLEVHRGLGLARREDLDGRDVARVARDHAGELVQDARAGAGAEHDAESIAHGKALERSATNLFPRPREGRRGKESAPGPLTRPGGPFILRR